ncbi:hypothetical protein D3C73_1429730 [compost metagenome]
MNFFIQLSMVSVMYFSIALHPAEMLSHRLLKNGASLSQFSITAKAAMAIKPTMASNGLAIAMRPSQIMACPALRIAPLMMVNPWST